MTVAELIAELRKYPPDMEITSKAVDCGGYDAILTDEIVVETFTPENGTKERLYVGGKDEQI